MKQLILVKQSNSIQLAHLYEHLFCASVDTWFYRQHMFQHLDYFLVGRTYYNGIVYIDLTLHTDSATRAANQVSALDIRLDNEAIGIAASQLIAEKEEPFSGKGIDAVRQALEELHHRPWQPLDDVGVIDPISVRRKPGVLYIAEGKSLPARKLTTSIKLDAAFAVDHRELLPLFRQFAWLVTENLQTVLADEFGFFSFDDTFKSTKKRIELTNIFKVPNGDDAALDDVVRSCKTLVQDLRRYNAFMRLTHDLTRYTHFHQSYLLPHPENNLVDTGILIGTKGWKQTATEANCSLLLKHMSIEVRYGRERVTRSLL